MSDLISILKVKNGLKIELFLAIALYQKHSRADAKYRIGVQRLSS